jgi:aminoglycoside/choline kinase family phosphotransferase
MERFHHLNEWLAQRWPGEALTLQPASADASFRRYFRVSRADGTTLIVMDAPPALEDCRPWLAIGKLLSNAGVHVPNVFAEDLERGFLLISDLGSTQYLEVLNAESADGLYADAIETLLRIQQHGAAEALPAYDAAFLQREIDLFPEWYLGRHLGYSPSNDEMQRFASASAQLLACHAGETQVFVHRDFHSRNLMYQTAADSNPGVIDFQGALRGPISYDLASLFRDAYISWDEERVIDWLVRYWQRARAVGLSVPADFADFYRNFEWMGVQRHLKILGIFARLHHRDGKDGYLKDMPRVAHYLRQACARYSALTPILRLLDRAEDRQVKAGYTF